MSLEGMGVRKNGQLTKPELELWAQRLWGFWELWVGGQKLCQPVTNPEMGPWEPLPCSQAGHRCGGLGPHHLRRMSEGGTVLRLQPSSSSRLC